MDGSKHGSEKKARLATNGSYHYVWCVFSSQNICFFTESASLLEALVMVGDISTRLPSWAAPTSRALRALPLEVTCTRVSFVQSLMDGNLSNDMPSNSAGLCLGDG